MRKPGDVLRRTLQYHLPPNLLANRLLRPFPAERLPGAAGVPFRYLDATSEEYLAWLSKVAPAYGGDGPFSKKPLEFFGTWTLLEPRPQDVFLDAAGGVFTYLDRLCARERYLHDLAIGPTLRERLGPGVRYLESDAAAIPLPDASVDKISCHHSFEHFEGEADTGFVAEIQRLLRPGGRACILPIFVGDRYYEVTTDFALREKRYDRASRRLVDPTAGVPGGNAYARIYDPAALHRRVLDRIDRRRFAVEIVELRLDGRPVPDLTLPRNRKVTRINCPFRALLIPRRAD